MLNKTVPFIVNSKTKLLRGPLNFDLSPSAASKQGSLLVGKKIGMRVRCFKYLLWLVVISMTQAANFPGAEVTSAHEGPQPPRKRRRIVPDNIDDTREPQVKLTDGMCMQIKELCAELDECCRHLYGCSRICVQRKRASIK